MTFFRNSVSVANYSEAIFAAGELLLEEGAIHADYIAEMVAVVDELGPYMVVTDGVALAHAKPGDLVFRDSISLAVLSDEVDFKGKPVRAVFALAATDHDAHIDRLGRVAELLADEQERSLLLSGEPSLTLINTLGE